MNLYLFVYGLLAHIIADWFLQNQWQAEHKTSLRHPAAWVHSGLHLACLLFVFRWPVAALLAVSHLLIDTRSPLIWWRRLIRQGGPKEVMIPFALMQDQAAHVLCLAFAASVRLL